MRPRHLLLLITVISFAAPLTGKDPMLDWGDAPDGPYPTLASSDGASHGVSALWLGDLVDAEPDGQPDATATGDDLADSADEDGIGLLWPLHPGAPSAVTVDSTGHGLLNAWIDFNGDGDWDDSGEQVAADLALSAGVNHLSFPAPSIPVADSTFARFRYTSLSSGGTLTATGSAADGEVEDHRIFGALFADGFETGGAGGWSTTQP